MSEPSAATQPPNDKPADDESGQDADLGGLTVEDDPQGTVDPADLAGTAKPSDDDVAYAPEHSEAETKES